RTLAAGEITTFAPPDCGATSAQLAPDQLDAFDRWSDQRGQFFQAHSSERRPYVRVTPVAGQPSTYHRHVARYHGGYDRYVTGYRGGRAYVSGGGGARYARRGAYSEPIAYYDTGLPGGVDRYLPGIYDLDRYGSWVDYNGTACWHPEDVADDWR